MNDFHIISWDWKEQPNIYEIIDAIRCIIKSGGTPKIFNISIYQKVEHDDYCFVICSSIYNIHDVMCNLNNEGYDVDEKDIIENFKW